MRGLDQLLGRAEDAASVAGLLADYPLVTLLGPGGIGKTTLAMSLAGEVISEFPGGVHVVELAGLGPGDDASYFAARQLDVDTLSALRLRAAGNRTLVVLDNCETAVEGAADVARELTLSADVRVLATSRSPLRVAGERVYALAPLALPGADAGEILDAPAVQLFVRRALEAGATWEPTGSQLSAIARVVHRLDGLPLAIELAAARSRMLTPQELVAHLDQQLDLLARPGDEEDRHRSLRLAIGTSYMPLPSRLKGLLRRLSTLPGAFDVALAHRVASPADSELATLDALTELLDASLLDARTDDSDGTSYRLLDSIRAFALEQLELEGEHTEAHERFVDEMTGIADEILIEGMSNFSTELLARIRARFPQLAAAINWCLDNDDTADRANRLVLPFYGPTGSRSEVAELARRVVTRWDESAPLQAEALAVAGTLNFIAADYAAGERFAQAALDDPAASDLARTIAYRTRGMIAATAQDLDEAKELLQAGIDLSGFAPSFQRELQIAWAAVCLDTDERQAVVDVLEDMLDEAERSDEAITAVWAGVTLTFHRLLADDRERAAATTRAALEAAGRSAVPWSVSTAHRVAGGTAAIVEGWEAASAHFREALETAVAGGDMEGMAMVLRAAAGAAKYLGDDERASLLWATIPSTQGIPVLRSIFHEHEVALAETHGRPAGTDLAELASAARDLLTPAAEDVPVIDDGDHTTYRFENTEVDLGRHELRRDGEIVHVEPQVFDVLVYLLERAGELVTKNEILDNVWGDRFVSEAALSSRIAFARKALGDDGKQQRAIRTVHGRGFMFVAELV